MNPIVITTPIPPILLELAYPVCLADTVGVITPEVWVARGIPVVIEFNAVIVGAVFLSAVTELIPEEVTVTVIVGGVMAVYVAEVPRILAGIALPIPLLVQGLGRCIVTVFGRAFMSAL
jgi:hypothetical protein